MERNRVFLGGTCNGTKWREEIISFLCKRGIEYFNPVVSDWTPDCQVREEIEKKICNIHLYIITPEMKGVYSIAEIIDSVYKHLEKGKCIVGFLGSKEEWGESQWRSLNAVLNLIHDIAGENDNIKASWINKPKDVLLDI